MWLCVCHVTYIWDLGWEMFPLHIIRLFRTKCKENSPRPSLKTFWDLQEFSLAYFLFKILMCTVLKLMEMHLLASTSFFAHFGVMETVMEMLNLKKKQICKVYMFARSVGFFFNFYMDFYSGWNVSVVIVAMSQSGQLIHQNCFHLPNFRIYHFSHQSKSTWSKRKNFLYFLPPQILASPAPFFWCNAPKKCATRRRAEGKKTGLWSPSSEDGWRRPKFGDKSWGGVKRQRRGVCGGGGGRVGGRRERACSAIWIHSPG